ncbi:MAG TPA: hypothetical protein VFT22_32790 [Kofleriaceae bacterium]|nr:hypothetical protein [Kofleriaceae bacterium]
MFGPYRTPPAPQRADRPRPQDELVLGWALVILGGMRVVVAIATGETWGTEATIAALMVPAGVRLLAWS